MIPDFTGDFINAKSVKDGDVIEIVDAGKVEFNDILKKDIFNIKVKHNERIKKWSPNNKHGSMLQKIFGMDTEAWVGKKVQLMLIEDKMLIKPLIEVKA